MHQDDDQDDLPRGPWPYALAAVLFLAILAYGFWDW